VGYAGAVNHGASLAKGELLLLLNPDTEVYPDMVTSLVEATRDRTVGVAGCKVYNPDGVTLQHAGGYIRDNGLSMHYGVGERDNGQFDEVMEVAYVTGAALAVGRGVFEDAGAFDPGYYPAYFEETDLCLRVRRMGHRVIYVPGARVLHHESVTTGRFTRRYYYLYHRNRVRFMLKNFSWRFLRDRALAMERRWLGMIDLSFEGPPLRKAYLINVLMLPRTLLARWNMERSLRAPRIEDTTSEL
jgi:GT2 family glycosyltransferase